jgi:two-component system OmpR family response regulator
MTESPHILLVEDDQQISHLIQRFLRMQAKAYRLSVARNAKEMDASLAASRIDLILLDIMLPDEDGFSICRRLRVRSNVPVIMLTARDDDYDRILGLEMGADDYITKPFNPRELLARVRAVLRRSPRSDVNDGGGTRVMRFLGWALDCKHRLLLDASGVRVAITGAEFELLRVLCERPGRVLSRDQLLDLTRGRGAGMYDRSVDILISRLRRKIERDPHEPDIIKTVRSSGYLFTPDVDVA